jgi:ketosteroid isomerase-like protein
MESEIVRTTAALVTALERGDVVAAAAAYADDAKLLAPAAGIVESRAAIEAYWQAGIDLGLSGVTFDRQLLEPFGDRVLEIGRYAIWGSGERRKRRVVRGTYLVLHSSDPGGSCRRAVEVFTPDEPTPTRHGIQKEET